MTPGCTKQACDFRDNLDELNEAGLDVVGISPDKPEKLAKFREAERLTFPLLSDPDRKMLKAYGAFGEKTMYGKTVQGVIRSTFVVDEKGKIAVAQYNVKAAHTTTNIKKIIAQASDDGVDCAASAPSGPPLWCGLGRPAWKDGCQYQLDLELGSVLMKVLFIAAVLAGATTLAATAHADPNDAEFLQNVRNGMGREVNDGPALINSAHELCDELKKGRPIRQLYRASFGATPSWAPTELPTSSASAPRPTARNFSPNESDA